MGYGDQLMAAGLAEALHAQAPTAGPVTICDQYGNPRWQPLWARNPAIGVTKSGPRITCGAGCLPYLVYPRRDHRLEFSPTYRARDLRGHIYLTPEELAYGRDVADRHGAYILIEPTPTDRKNVNRCWPRASWEALLGELQRLSFTTIQCAHPDATRLPGVPAVATPTFRDACGVIKAARLVVCLEGGVAFAAAALGTPAVVLWGGCISAGVLSFPEHVNLVDDDPQTPCGALRPCDHCTRAWARLTPARVAAAVYQALGAVPVAPCRSVI